MKRKILLLTVFLLLIFSVRVIYIINNINVFTIDTINLPQIEKFNVEVYKIDKIKVWEMKNVYANNGDYWFEEMQDGKKTINRFYMVNKEVKDADDFAVKFISLMKPEFSSDEIVVKYFFYRKSKKLPKYWMPVWDRHCIDALFMHKDDLLFTITIDINKNILSINIL